MAMAVIDYIRQYTLDKKMETWVKGSGILGGKGKVGQICMVCNSLSLALFFTPH
jgi:hypothetical protein